MTLRPLLRFYFARVCEAVDNESVCISDHETVMLRAASINVCKGKFFPLGWEFGPLTEDLCFWTANAVFAPLPSLTAWRAFLHSGSVRLISVAKKKRIHYSLLLIALLQNTITGILVKWKIAYLHSGESHESIFSVVTNCGSDEQKSEPEGGRDEEAIIDSATTSRAHPLMAVLRPRMKRTRCPHSHCLTEQNSTRNSSPPENLPSKQHAQSDQQPQTIKGPNSSPV